MKLIFSYISRYKKAVAAAMVIKFIGTLSELLLPYILEHMVDDVVPTREIAPIFFWGFCMLTVTVVTRQLNVTANRMAIRNAHFVSYDVRQALFEKTANLTGPQFDRIGLPSLTSRMTSDSYNVQSCAQSLQTMCVRTPILLLGGILVTLFMDRVLALVLVVMVPLLILVSVCVSHYGIPLFHLVQERLDHVVLVMRENITGIRVVKALSKEDFERRRFAVSNRDMMRSDIRANTVMAIPGPFMQTCLNVALTIIVVLGAVRVNSGAMKPGVILAFLTYVNMITMGVMGFNRLFVMLSKASASADRIAAVLSEEDGPEVLPSRAEPLSSTAVPASANPLSSAGTPPYAKPLLEKTHEEENVEKAVKKEPVPLIRFDHVSFRYVKAEENAASGNGFAGASQERCLDDISFTVKRGESLGIIGPTGCGKTTILNLLMRFYDADSGAVYVGGRDVRTYEKDGLHRKFGAVFQNDMVFQDTLGNNIAFGRALPEEDLMAAAEDAQAAEYIRNLKGGLHFRADIRGANLSGGQRQRLLVARALAGRPEILVLDDSSSALDYKTDAALRKAIAEHHRDSTVILIAQRVSSVQNMTNILVLDEGRCIGYGPHESLLKECPAYREIYETQMGALA